MNIYVDFDDCLCETGRAFSKLAAEMFGIEIPYENMRFFNLQQAFYLSDEQYDRLLVRGHRVENANGNAMVIADAIQIRPVYIAPFLAIPILILLLLYVLITTGIERRGRRSRKDEYLAEHGLPEEEPEIGDRDLILEAVQKYLDKNKKKM